VLLVGVGIPILIKVLGYLPFASSLAYWLKPRYVYPTLLSRHVRPLYHVFHVPTVGQSIFIGFFVTLNIVLTAVEYTSVSPNTWFPSSRIEVMAYVANRSGALAMALLPLTILFAGRNNILLWLSDWSHSTYLLHHRWIARLCALQIILHSIVELQQHVELSDYPIELKELYWIWGCVGTVAVAIMVLAAQFRRYYYEIFLISHIVLAIFVLVGTWYHIDYLFQRKFAYEYWIYLCCAIWFTDRVIRLGRIFKVGVKQATLRPIGDEVVRVDIPDVRWSVVPGQHAYLYLPATRKWAPWENHPFSVIPTSLLSARRKLTPADSIQERQESVADLISSRGGSDTEKSEMNVGVSLPVVRSTNRLSSVTSGITIFTKRHKGITAGFAASTLSALLDGPYRNTAARPILNADRLVLIAGGIGITGILPFVHAHPNVKLYWSVRSAQAALIDEFEPTIPGHVERSIHVGSRNDLTLALAEEVKAGWGLVGAVVCGPGGMCDEVRNRVAWLGKHYPATKWQLDVEAFLY
jgi:predicted ferric reductase